MSKMKRKRKTRTTTCTKLSTSWSQPVIVDVVMIVVSQTHVLTKW